MIGATLIAVGSLLVSEKPRSTLVEPTATLPKATVVGNASVATIPVPLNATVVGLPDAVLAMVSVPSCEPSTPGEKVMLMLQLPPAATAPEVEQAGLPIPVSLYPVPAVTLIELMLTAALPVFLNRTFSAADVVLSATPPKFTELGVAVACATAKSVEIRQSRAVRQIRIA